MLAGGVGGARFLQGLVEVVPAARVVVIGNVGDDFEPYGLHVSPDLDTVLYTLTGWIDEEQGLGACAATPTARSSAPGARRRRLVLAGRPRHRPAPGPHRGARGGVSR